MNKLKQAALRYAADGWPIFPANAKKEPLTENGVIDATTKQSQIEAWWDKWPKANIALDVAGAGMMVVDTDPGHDIGELEEKYGGLKKTNLLAQTPRGGNHYFYAIGEDERIPASASKVAANVDIRSFHSYVLLSPSRTPDGNYDWVSEGKPSYRADDMKEAACATHKDKSDNWDDWIIEPDLDENVAKAVKWLEEEAAPAIEGRGGDAMAYKTAAMMKSFGLSPETAFEVMWDYWNPKCVPPWGSDEADHLEQKVINGYSYNTSPPGNMTQAYKTARAQELFSPVSRDTKGGGTEIKAGRFRAVDRQGMKEIKPPKWLIKDTLPERGYAMLVGKRGTFKTFVALDMALSVATGGMNYFEDNDEWEGNFPEISKPGPVAIAVGEGRSSINNRVKAWELENIEGDEAPNIVLIDPVPRPDEEDINAFIDTLLGLHDDYSLVVLDTVGRSMQGLNENSQQDASQFTRMVETIQYELDCAVLAIHHSGHNEEGRARGSSVFGADVDSEFIIDRANKDHVIKLMNTKQKDGPEWQGPRLIHLKKSKHVNSLVAVKASDKQVKDVTSKTGRKTEKDKQDYTELVRKVAYQFLKKAPGKEYTGNGLATAIAADERIPLSVQAIRKNYLGNLLIDKAHPINKCFDDIKNRWSYNK